MSDHVPIQEQIIGFLTCPTGFELCRECGFFKEARCTFEPLCSREWFEKHAHDLDNWKPTIEIVTPGHKATFSSKDAKVLKKAIKAMRG